MAEPQETESADSGKEGGGKQVHRSPAYPFVALDLAIDRARAFWAKENRHSARIAVAAGHWGYKGKSSGTLLTVSALKQHGLLEDDGSGAERTVKISELARQIILDEVPDSPQRVAAIKRSALTPKLYADLWRKWGAALPSDESFRTFLRLDEHFNDAAAQAVLKNYKATLTFAKMAASDKLPDAALDAKVTVAVGDYIQWESAGVLQFPEPKRVSKVSPDGAFVFVEGSETGLPMAEIAKAEQPAQPARFVETPTPPTPPLTAAVAGQGAPLAQGTTLPPMNWVLSVPRGVRAQLIITGNVRADDLKRLKAQLDFLVDSLDDPDAAKN